jgi:hypothetical protein
MKIIAKIKEWYRGRYVPPSNDLRSALVFISGHYDQPILAKALGILGRFWLAHWKWIVPTIIFPLVGLIYHHYFAG